MSTMKSMACPYCGLNFKGHADRKTKGCTTCYAARYSHELGCDIGPIWHEFYRLIDKGKVGRCKKAIKQMSEMLEVL